MSAMQCSFAVVTSFVTFSRSEDLDRHRQSRLQANKSNKFCTYLQCSCLGCPHILSILFSTGFLWFMAQKSLVSVLCVSCAIADFCLKNLLLQDSKNICCLPHTSLFVSPKQNTAQNFGLTEVPLQ